MPNYICPFAFWLNVISENDLIKRTREIIQFYANQAETFAHFYESLQIMISGWKYIFIIWFHKYWRTIDEICHGPEAVVIFLILSAKNESPKYTACNLPQIRTMKRDLFSIWKVYYYNFNQSWSLGYSLFQFFLDEKRNPWSKLFSVWLSWRSLGNFFLSWRKQPLCVAKKKCIVGRNQECARSKV